MGFWDRFKKSTTPPPVSPRLDAPALPALPADGTIESYEIVDAVGSVRLADGSAIRFGKTACGGFEPAVGLAVRVLDAAIGPGNRVRAKTLELHSDAGEYDKLVEQRDRAAGLSIHEKKPHNDSRALGVIRLGVTTKAPILDKATLRALWTAAELDDFAPLELSPSALVTRDRKQFSLVFGPGPLDGLLDLRYRRDAVLGDGFLGIYEGVYGPSYEVGMPGSFWGFGAHGNARPQAAIIAKLARCADITGVIVACADQLWLPCDEWLRRADGHDNPTRIRVEAFVDVAYGPEVEGARHLRSFGMHRGLGLPDVEVIDALAGTDDDRHYVIQSIAWMACRILAGEDAYERAAPETTLPVGTTVTVNVEAGRASFRVAHFDAQERLFRLTDVKLLDEN